MRFLRRDSTVKPGRVYRQRLFVVASNRGHNETWKSLLEVDNDVKEDVEGNKRDSVGTRPDRVGVYLSTIW